MCSVCSLEDELSEKKEKEYFLLERKKKLPSPLLYGFSHQPGSLINRDSEKKIPGGVVSFSPDIQAPFPII